jgi:hypothetical protein
MKLTGDAKATMATAATGDGGNRASDGARVMAAG